MAFIRILFLLIGSLIAIYPFVLKKNRKAAELIKKTISYKEIIGVFLFFLGVIHIIELPNYIKFAFYLNFLYGTILVIAIIEEIILGFVLSYQLLWNYFLSNNRKTEQKGREINQTLTKYRLVIGFLGLILSLILIIIELIYDIKLSRFS